MSDTEGISLSWSGRAPAAPQKPVKLELSKKGDASCMLLRGDNEAGMRALAQRSAGQFSLVYMDPPFFTGKTHSAVKRTRNKQTGAIVRNITTAFDDRWESLPVYLAAIQQRIAVARDLLRPDGCLVLHVDPKTSHYAKILCDETFGRDSFASEIVWRYRRWPSKTKNFQRVHDVLLRYVKDPGVTPQFHQLYEPLAPSTLATWGKRKQRAVVDADGRRSRSSKTDELTPGTPMGDVWEIGIVAPVAKERTGYPTQKPEALLERLITACTSADDLILDPYAGSGTTLAVAHRLGRRVVGIDASPESHKIIRTRLGELGVQPLEERIVLARAAGKPRAARRGPNTATAKAV